MCIAVFLPKEKKVKRKILKNCFENNPDGAGFSYIENEKIKIEKGFFNFDKFFHSFEKIKTDINSNMVLHFRIATHGKVDINNCQPFRINEDTILCHNGIINIKIPKDMIHMSDTSYYNSAILKHLPKEFYKNNAIMNLIRLSIDWSKFIIFHSSGNRYIVNEESGVWDKGIWFSNYTYEKSNQSRYINDYSSDEETSFKICEYCGKKLITKDEIYLGVCLDCIKEGKDKDSVAEIIKNSNRYYLEDEN